MYKILLCFMLFIGVGFSAAAQNPQKGDYVQFERKFDCGPLCSTPLFVIEGYVTYYHDGFLTIKVSAVLPKSGQTYTERDWEIAHRIVIGEELSYAYSEYYNLKILKEGAFHDQYEQQEREKEREKAERDRAREAWMKSLREERAALLKDIDVKTKAWSDTYNKPYVDLGLPSGTLWATVNVGARKPWETGNRYAWGETSPKSEYTASSYRYAKGHQERALLGNVTVYEPTKYNGNDKKIRLDLSDDAAYVNMGSEWCTPTQEQVNELYAYCILTSTTNYHGTGISGTLICRKDNLSVHIFIPDGDYWINQITSYKDLSILTCSYGDNTFSNTASGNSNARYVGNYVRAVKRSKQDLEAENAMQAKINNQAVNWVNLGLPSGTLWAVFNVGTNNFDNPGEKFALENYRIRNTEWRNEDPVKTYLGKDWRMPTKAEYDELMQYCTKHGYSDGLVFKSKINGQTIGFPCDASGKGYYWSSTLIDDRNMYSGELIDSYSAYRLEFDINQGNLRVVKGLTSTGCYVRGVLVNKATAKLINDAAHKKWDNLKAQGKPYENVPLLRGEIYIYFRGEAMSTSTTTPTNRTSDASNVSNPSQTNITSNTNNPPQTNAPSNSDVKYVDLGLPSGTLWADCNIGASNPEEYGDYFAWGETNPKSNYTWSTLKYCEDNNGDKFSKYNTQSKYGTILERSDDAAAANWGSGWCMPTQEQFQELKDKCTWTLTTKNGKKGYEVKGLNGNALFLPAAGYRSGTSLNGDGSYGDYWSSSLYTDYPRRGRNLYFSSGYVDPGNWYRYFGFSVRPVRCRN